ncbi:hypothetical protein [Desulfonatronospira thiodismutans]|uniref:hypothetical protein n=1 Tax=Desulfonatronospira thiodismutans TaxID=488939 RepID=UPI0002F3FBC5|nr:hypothetical protein [Desulfonatronospira thiodismutans]RQD72871.1 MAG: hypothetical protein D5S03_13885 [Desulfonatronospira sp. MSAO_Bac3]
MLVLSVFCLHQTTGSIPFQEELYLIVHLSCTTVTRLLTAAFLEMTEDSEELGCFFVQAAIGQN